jgi:hypothetical protein
MGFLHYKDAHWTKLSFLAFKVPGADACITSKDGWRALAFAVDTVEGVGKGIRS